jgi:predicted ATPase
MRKFIITGAPGAGKTAIIRQLELDGFSWLKRQPQRSLPPAKPY